jgi:DNA polymerase-2
LSKDQSLSHSLSGFILTRQWRESATGVELIYWLAGDLGPLRFQTSRQEAVSFFHERETVLMYKEKRIN